MTYEITVQVYYIFYVHIIIQQIKYDIIVICHSIKYYQNETLTRTSG